MESSSSTTSTSKSEPNNNNNNNNNDMLLSEQSILSSFQDNTNNMNNKPKSNNWIRGVNLGGWLVMERYISPYHFAITDCHVRGEYCWYPGSVSAPSNISDDQYCNLHKCSPVRTVTVTSNGALDYPIDEWTMGETFLKAYASADDSLTRPKKGIAIAERWLNYHFENFITRQDIAVLAAAGVTHFRVPLPHYILGDVMPEEPWIVGNRWDAFVNMCHIAREHNIQVWPDLHTAPGSQNGFDNSGKQNGWSTCTGWSDNTDNINRTIRIIDNITKKIATEQLNDVVTGFGLLNEPFLDCDRDRYINYIAHAKNIVRQNLGENISIYVSDMFRAATFNDGHWWLNNENNENDTNKNNIQSKKQHWWDTTKESLLGIKTTNNESISNESNMDVTNPFHDTYLDSHYYQVFDATTRKFTPAQHIAYTCQQQYMDAVSCCYEKETSWLAVLLGQQQYGRDKALPTNGVRRIFGEWSGAYDTLPVEKLNVMMNTIATTGEVLDYYRTFSRSQIDFLMNFVQAQMVVFESQQVGASHGWFFWTAKMEGGAFAEWDFLRGIKEGWIPAPLPPRDINSETLFGTCYDILLRTNDTDAAVEDIIHTFPDPNLPGWGTQVDDDVVLSHGQSLIDKNGRYPLYPRSPLVPISLWSRLFGDRSKDDMYYYGSHHKSTTDQIVEWTIIGIAGILLFFIVRFIYKNTSYYYINSQKRNKYKPIPNTTTKGFDYDNTTELVC